jgi:protein gp37
MNRTNIEFADFSWNPIVGCRNGCEYCWAKKFNNRYFKTDFQVPQFHEERLNEKIPGLPKVRNYIAQAISPDKPVIFTVDMGDIFSLGVELSWINSVFAFAKLHQEVTFLFLTKRPEYYQKWSGYISRENSIIGTSLDFAHNYKRVLPIIHASTFGFKTFVNIEPLMSRMDQVDFSGIDFVTVGALTGRKYRPDATWHKSINHPVIYYKRNYIAYFPELLNHGL